LPTNLTDSGNRFIVWGAVYKLCQFTQNFTDISHKTPDLKIPKILSQLLPVPGA